MSDTTKIPSGHKFQIGNGQPFELDRVVALQKWNAIRGECRAAGQGDNFEHAIKFATWLSEHVKQTVTPGQADAIIDACQSGYVTEKKALEALLSLPSSTEPPPSNSTNELD